MYKLFTFNNIWKEYINILIMVVRLQVIFIFYNDHNFFKTLELIRMKTINSQKF